MKITLKEIKTKEDVYHITKKIADKYKEELMMDLENEVTILLTKVNNSEFSEKYYNMMGELVDLAKRMCIGMSDIETQQRCLWLSDDIDRHNGVISKDTKSIAAWNIVDGHSLARLVDKEDYSYTDEILVGNVLAAIIGEYNFHRAEEIDSDTVEITWCDEYDEKKSSVYSYRDILDMVKGKLVRINISIKE